VIDPDVLNAIVEGVELDLDNDQAARESAANAR